MKSEKTLPWIMAKSKAFESFKGIFDGLSIFLKTFVDVFHKL